MLVDRDSARYREPARDKPCGMRCVGPFHRGDELERSSAGVTIAETLPDAFVRIDDKLLAIGSLVYRARAEELRADTLQVRKDAVSFEHGNKRH